MAHRCAAGGPEQHVFDGVGFSPIEAPWEGGLYYSRVVDGVVQVVRRPLAGDDVEVVVARAPAARLLGWQLRRYGLYLCFAEGDGRFTIVRRSLADGEERHLLQIASRSTPSFDVSVDETRLLFDRVDYAESDVVGLRWAS